MDKKTRETLDIVLKTVKWLDARAEVLQRTTRRNWPLTATENALQYGSLTQGERAALLEALQGLREAARLVSTHCAGALAIASDMKTYTKLLRTFLKRDADDPLTELDHREAIRLIKEAE